MTDARMFDLSISALADGGFELEQLAGSLEEPDRITLHPCQVRYLAECAGLLPQPDPSLLDRFSARHIGRLHALRDKIGSVRELYLDEILDHCGAGVEISLHLLAISELANDLIEDTGTGTATPAEPVAECHEKSAAISVTSKRGRPKKEDALTPAERQAKHRARQTDLPLTGNESPPASYGHSGAMSINRPN